jgi:hypothetical protein
MADSRAKDYHIEGKYLYVCTYKVFAEICFYLVVTSSPAVKG